MVYFLSPLQQTLVLFYEIVDTHITLEFDFFEDFLQLLATEKLFFGLVKAGNLFCKGANNRFIHCA